ncbi:DUF3883 domain-containing protein [Flavobacterium chungbukense]|nr:DUF3883 domain-containing protein [Flavobacterium chungbukense]
MSVFNAIEIKIYCFKIRFSFYISKKQCSRMKNFTQQYFIAFVNSFKIIVFNCICNRCYCCLIFHFCIWLCFYALPKTEHKSG